ncbi:MAG: lytic transglycosylase domain-containing protein [Clostridia bacterium]|nr:lytic transglycosylase domain-containing protein [Clostridia bacterium]
MKKSIKFLIILIILLALYFVFFKVRIDKIILKKIYPLEYTEYVEKYSREYNIDKYLVYAIIKAESNFNENAKSNTDAIGLMQIMGSTAMETAEKMEIQIIEDDLFNPEINIKIGLKYYKTLMEKYNNNYQMAIVAYNAGIGNVNKWIAEGIIKKDGSNLEKVPFKETNNYLRKTVRNYEIYKDLYQ